MKQGNNQSLNYSIGQVAKRWGISPERVRQLVEVGKLVGAFTIPSAGRFGKTMRIPIETVLEAEKDWATAPSLSSDIKRPRKRSSTELALRHFPEFAEGQPDLRTEV